MVLVILDAEWSEIASPCKFISNLGTRPGHNFKQIFAGFEIFFVLNEHTQKRTFIVCVNVSTSVFFLTRSYSSNSQRNSEKYSPHRHKKNKKEKLQFKTHLTLSNKGRKNKEKYFKEHKRE